VACLPCNLSDLATVEDLVRQAEETLGGLDILVCNAAVTKDNLALRMKDDEWQQVIDINLTASFRLARAAMKGMLKRRFGRIIFITSVVGATGNPGQANYCASKAGLTGMSKSLAQEVATRGITVNCIAPGFIATAMTDLLTDDQKARITRNIPLGRMGTPEDIAAGALYLASDQAAYMTGQTLHINGGMYMA
jgi:3-oxoacyl-[acyl-carrier protein] reductase